MFGGRVSSFWKNGPRLFFLCLLGPSSALMSAQSSGVPGRLLTVTSHWPPPHRGTSVTSMDTW